MSATQEITIRDTAAQAQTAAQSRPPAEDLQDMQGEKMVLNMGPSHPSTHGVLRIVLELDGEIITKAVPDVGYLHRGDEKIAENMTYTQFIPYTDRLDYLAPLANNVAYALAVEKLLGIHDKLPPRCQYLRVMSDPSRQSAQEPGGSCDTPANTVRGARADQKVKTSSSPARSGAASSSPLANSAFASEAKTRSPPASA